MTTWARNQIVAKLEPAVRAFLADPSQQIQLRATVDELDEWDTERDRAAERDRILREIRRVLIERTPLVKVAEAVPCKPRGWRTCSFRGAWTFDGLDASFCKRHAASERGAAAEKQLSDAAFDVLGRPLTLYSERGMTPEQATEIAGKLRVEL